MSRLLVVTRPSLVVGFQLAGVDAYSLDDVEAAQELIDTWMASGETALLAIDDGFLENMEPWFLKKLNSCEQLPFLAIPSGQPLGLEFSRKHRIAEMIRRAIGFHVTFRGEESEVEN